MDVKLLHDLKFEVDRLYISGLRLINSNPRIANMTASLKKYVEEEEACRELVDALEDLLEIGHVMCADSLSKVHSRLFYLLHLYGETIAPDEEKFEQTPMFDINNVTHQRSFLELRNVIDTLSETEEDLEERMESEASLERRRLGRPEVIKKAREEKLFDDFRTYPYLDKALASEQLEVVEVVEDIIKKDLGSKMVPFLLNNFEYDARIENLRRFTLLCEIGYENLSEMLDEVIESNVTNLQSRALQYMLNNKAYEDQIISLADSTQKALREMAIILGLAELKTEKAERKLCELYAKALRKKSRSEIELVMKALLQTKLQYTFADVLSLAEECFENLLAAGKKVDVDSFSSLRLAISVLKMNVNANVPEFFFKILFHADYNNIIKKRQHLLAKPAKDISYAMIEVMLGADTEQLVAFYEKVIREMEESEWKRPFYKMYLNACVNNNYSVEQIYETFAPFYLNKSIGVEDIAELCGVDKAGAPSDMDSRWMDLLYETLQHIDEEENIETLLRVMDALEPESSEKYNEELIEAGRRTKKYLLEVTSMIMKRNLPDKYETVFSLIKHCHDLGVSGSNALRQLPRAAYWEEFPKEYVARFKGLKNAPRAIYIKIVGE